MATTTNRVGAWRLVPLLLVFCLLPPLTARGADDKYSPAELEEIVGPIALYPDIVLTSLLPASTAASDVVQAARWVGSQEGEITEVPADKNWDPAVEAMVQFPDVLVWMSGNLDWMEMLAYAVAVQEDDVLQAVQDVRLKAQEAGNLKSDDHLQVVQEQEVIYIQPAQPDVVYIPTYDPYAVVRPGYVWGPSSWGVGFAMGVAGAWAWHHINWGHGGHGHLDITPHRYNNFTNNGNLNVNVGSGNRWTASNRPGKRPAQMPSSTRPRPRQKRPGSAGRPGSGGVKPRPERPSTKPGGRPGDRPTRPSKPPSRPGTGKRPSTPPSRPSAGARPTRPSQPAARPAPSRSPGDRSAMGGAANNGRSAQKASSRGRASTSQSSGAQRSRPSSGSARSGGGRSGGGRSSGGRARGGRGGRR